MWEKHCEAALIACGWKVIDNWSSMYWHSKLKCFLMVYVDDFKMAGPLPL